MNSVFRRNSSGDFERDMAGGEESERAAQAVKSQPMTPFARPLVVFVGRFAGLEEFSGTVRRVARASTNHIK